MTDEQVVFLPIAKTRKSYHVIKHYDENNRCFQVVSNVNIGSIIAFLGKFDNFSQDMILEKTNTQPFKIAPHV